MMTPRERLAAAIDHREPDKVPVDLDGTPVSGMSASVLSGVRVALGLDRPGDRTVRIYEPYQLLGQVTDDLREALGIDTVGVPARTNLFGFENTGWKPWDMPDGTPVLVPAAFNTMPEANGDLLQYPGGDHSVPASGRMPAGGYYHDTIIRQDPIDEGKLNPDDNLEEFQPLPEADVQRFGDLSTGLYAQTPYAICANFGGTGFGDIAMVPGPFLKHPKGIRDVAEWYMSTAMRRDYIYEVFERQCATALANLARIAAVVGDRVQVVFTSGTDFGTQKGPFVSPQSYRDLFKPFHRTVNDWIHAHTNWKSMIHTCGGVEPLIADFIEAGFDIMNPVQCSAACMEPEHLKREFGAQITFWGAGVDTQKTLPFGTPEEVRREALERLEVFAPGGGYVFNAIHNIQPKTPVPNVLAMFAAVREFNGG